MMSEGKFISDETVDHNQIAMDVLKTTLPADICDKGSLLLGMSGRIVAYKLLKDGDYVFELSIANVDDKFLQLIELRSSYSLDIGIHPNNIILMANVINISVIEKEAKIIFHLPKVELGYHDLPLQLQKLFQQAEGRDFLFSKALDTVFAFVERSIRGGMGESFIERR